MNKIVTFSNTLTHAKLKLTEYMGEIGYMKNGIFHRKTNFSATVIRHMPQKKILLSTFSLLLFSELVNSCLMHL